MSSDEQLLFEIYVLLQDLMEDHVGIDQYLRGDVPHDPQHLERIATHAEQHL